MKASKHFTLALRPPRRRGISTAVLLFSFVEGAKWNLSVEDVVGRRSAAAVIDAQGQQSGDIDVGARRGEDDDSSTEQVRPSCSAFTLDS